MPTKYTQNLLTPLAPRIATSPWRLALQSSLQFLLPFSLLFLAENTHNAALAKSELGWSLTQNRKNLGIYKVYMASSGMCIEMPNERIIVLCLPPGKTVFVINLTSKRSYQVPLANFEGQMLRHLAIGKGMVVTDVPVVKTGQTIEKNIMMDSYGIDSKRHKKYLAHAAASVYELRQIAQQIYISALADRPFPATGKLMTKLYGLPELNTMPVHTHYQDPEGGAHTVLNTLSISRKNIDSKLVLPTGLKQSSLAEVLLDGNESALDILSN